MMEQLQEKFKDVPDSELGKHLLMFGRLLRAVQAIKAENPDIDMAAFAKFMQNMDPKKQRELVYDNCMYHQRIINFVITPRIMLLLILAQYF